MDPRADAPVARRSIVHRIGKARWRHFASPAVASAWHSSWQLCPSPPEEENTLARSAGFSPACAVASSAMASASLTTRPTRRRSAAGSIVGVGNRVGTGRYGRCVPTARCERRASLRVPARARRARRDRLRRSLRAAENQTAVGAAETERIAESMSGWRVFLVLLDVARGEGRIDMMAVFTPPGMKPCRRASALIDRLERAGGAQAVAGGALGRTAAACRRRTGYVTAWLSARSLLGVPVPCRLM